MAKDCITSASDRSPTNAASRGPRRWSMLALLLSWGLTWGCGLSDDPPPNPTIRKDGQVVREDGGPGTMPKPAVDPVPATACTKTVPIHGTTLTSASIIVEGGANSSGLSMPADPLTGTFCVDVPLNLGTTNTLEVRAFSGALGKSEPVVVTVTQVSCDEPSDPGAGSDELVNVAAGLFPKASSAPEAGGELSALTDGDPQTVAVFESFAVTTADEWILLELDTLIQPQSIIVTWRDTALTGDAFATQYKILASDLGEPGDPAPDSDSWIILKEITEGKGGVDEHVILPPQPMARKVALWLEEDNKTSPYITFAIGEIAVMVKKDGSGPPPEENTCASGGW